MQSCSAREIVWVHTVARAFRAHGVEPRGEARVTPYRMRHRGYKATVRIGPFDVTRRMRLDCTLGQMTVGAYQMVHELLEELAGR